MFTYSKCLPRVFKAYNQGDGPRHHQCYLLLLLLQIDNMDKMANIDLGKWQKQTKNNNITKDYQDTLLQGVLILSV